VLADDLMEFDSRKWWTSLFSQCHGVYSAVLPPETDFLSCYRLMLEGRIGGGGGGGGGRGAEVERSLALTTKSLMELNTGSAYATTVMRPFNGQRKRHHAQQYSKHAR
jgi:hypothetical protein